jgi:hypothetical protein
LTPFRGSWHWLRRQASASGAAARYGGGTRAPIEIIRILRSASLGLLCCSLLTSTTVLSAWSAFPSARAGGSTCALLPGSKRISIPGIAAIGTPAEGLPKPTVAGKYIQPARSNVAYSDCQNARPSSAPWEITARYRWPLNGATAAAMTCWRSGPSVRGALSLSSANFAAAVSFSEFAARSIVSAICVRCLESLSCWTPRTVEISTEVLSWNTNSAATPSVTRSAPKGTSSIRLSLNAFTNSDLYSMTSPSARLKDPSPAPLTITSMR